MYDIFNGFFQPIYTATLFVVYLLLCCWALDHKLLKFWISFFVWIGVLSGQILDNLGIWSPEDLINQRDRYLVLNFYKRLLVPSAIGLLSFSAGYIFLLVENKFLYAKMVTLVGLVFILYIREINGWRLKKIKFLKSFFISMSWILLALAIDFGINRQKFFITSNDVIFILSSFVLLVSDTLLLDHKDRVGDRIYGIYSFPKSWDFYLVKIVLCLNLLSLFIVVGLSHVLEVPKSLLIVLIAAHLVLSFSTLIIANTSSRVSYLIGVSLWIPLSFLTIFLMPPNFF